MGQAPATGTVSLRTFPRNFKGRSGSRDDRVYLCSPETAAVSALTGRITDPRTFGKMPAIAYPPRFSYRDDWFVNPAENGDSVEIIRGPNIMPFPKFPPLSDTIEAQVLIKTGDNVSTDDILPAGSRVLPLRSNIPAISEYVFAAIDEGFAKRAKAAGKGIVVGGVNYGQGSSREHAALGPRYLGVQVKIVKSFARIHKANLVNFGIVPLEFNRPDDYDRINQGDTLRITNLRSLVASGQTDIAVQAGPRVIMTRLDISQRQRIILLAGGILDV
jgi:aconitate hydratase